MYHIFKGRLMQRTLSGTSYWKAEFEGQRIKEMGITGIGGTYKSILGNFKMVERDQE